MRIEEIIIRLFCMVDDKLAHVNKRKNANLHSSELVTIGILFTLSRTLLFKREPRAYALKASPGSRENWFDKASLQEWMGSADGTVGARLPTRSTSSYLLANIRLPLKMLRLAKEVGVSCVSRTCIWACKRLVR